MKKSHNSTLHFLLNLCIAAVLALAFLSVYVICFNNSGVHVYNESMATDYKWEPRQMKSTIDEGFAWLKMDEDGFNNYSIPDNIDILLMGSSHMEAVNLPKDENVGYYLGELLHDKNIYNIGTSGHTIYTCVQNIKYAADYYRPSDYIVLETDTVSMDVDSMSEVVAETYPEIPSYDSGIVYMVQKKLPVAKSLFKALEDWRAVESGNEDSDEGWFSVDKADNTEVNNGDFGDVDADSAGADGNSVYRQALEQFMSKAALDSKTASGAKLIIFYHPTTSINDMGEFVTTTNPKELAAFEEACEKNGIIFVDMTADFERLYTKEHILAHGFANTAVGYGHLNKYGHRTIATKLSEIMEGENNGIK